MTDNMIPATHVATGTIRGLAVNGESCNQIEVLLIGPKGDTHASAIYDATTPNYKGEGLSFGRHGENQDRRWDGMTSPVVANHRSWTALSTDDLTWAATYLNIKEIPIGGMLETMVIEGINSFTAIPPGYELAIFRKEVQMCRLMVREPNTPCTNAARALYAKLNGPDSNMPPSFSREFKSQFKLTRGLMGSVIYPGSIQLEDEVRVFRPKLHPAHNIWDKQPRLNQRQK